MAPIVVAIHLTYLDEENNIHVGHFLSDVTSTTNVNTAGKFSEALAFLVDFVDQNNMGNQTIGIREFEDLHATQHFPGLGQVKKISMKHHIEFIMNQL
jgi:hypothetical protein